MLYKQCYKVVGGSIYIDSAGPNPPVTDPIRPKPLPGELIDPLRKLTKPPYIHRATIGMHTNDAPNFQVFTKPCYLPIHDTKVRMYTQLVFLHISAISDPWPNPIQWKQKFRPDPNRGSNQTTDNSVARCPLVDELALASMYIMFYFRMIVYALCIVLLECNVILNCCDNFQ